MLPKIVNICGIPHSIKLCEDSFYTDMHLGQINYAKAEIKINAGATPELQMQSLFHEMLHGMLVMIGRNDESQDENLVQSLASAMYQSFELKRQENE